MADEKREYSQRFRAAKVRAEMISRPSSDSAPAASSAPSRLPWDLYHVQAPEPSHAPQLSPKRWPMESRNMDDSTSVASVIGALERAPLVVAPLVREVPPSLLKRRPTTGKWSAHAHACHLAVVHGLFCDRLEQMLASPAPVITPYDPGTDDPDDALLRLDLEQSLESYVRDRRLLVERLRTLSPADWHKAAEHGEYSHYSVFIMFRHLALHDFFHAYRIEELLLNRDWAEEWREAQTTR